MALIKSALLSPLKIFSLHFIPHDADEPPWKRIEQGQIIISKQIH